MSHQDVSSSDGSTFARQFDEFAATCERRAPLYSSLSSGIAQDPELAGLLRFAPPTQRLPVLLFAVVHHLVLEDPSSALGRWYPNLTHEPRPPADADLMPTFGAFVDTNIDEIRVLLATRSTQTNEVGRCGFFLPALGIVAAEVGPLAHIDVGASGGLNLLLDRFEYRYTDAEGNVGHVGAPSTVLLEVQTTGPVPIPDHLPTIAAGCGIDRSPIDVTDEIEARWLEACVWPDQADRFHRLVAAIDIARRHRPELIVGDAVEALAPTVERLGEFGHPVVTNSWVLNYLTPAARVAYLAELDRIGSRRDLSWIYAEAPALIPELPNEPDPKDAQRTVLSLARWRNGTRTVDHLATCHPHGFWIHWR